MTDKLPNNQSSELVLTGDLKAKIDDIWKTFWSNGITDTLEILRQIYLGLLSIYYTFQPNFQQ